MTRHDAERRRKILESIARIVAERGYPPSVREIAEAVGLASPSAVHHHLTALERDGLLERGSHSSRALRLTVRGEAEIGVATRQPAPAERSRVTPFRMPMERDRLALPVIGEIAAGQPIEAYAEGAETLDVPRSLQARDDSYVLRVRGKSMIDDLIDDGDYVVVQPQATAHRRRHRRRAARGQRRHPEALLPREGPHPPSAGERRDGADLRHRGPDPGQGRRGHPQADLGPPQPAPYAGGSRSTRTILHADLDAFYASVEVRDDPSLRGKPVIVGGDRGTRGVVMAASYEARKFGVHSAMPIRTAVSLCPHGIFLPGRPDRYRELSPQVMRIFASYTPHGRADQPRRGIPRRHRQPRGVFGDGETIARQIKQRVLDEVGLVVSVGVATNKLCAKVASDLRKPDALVVVPPRRGGCLPGAAPRQPAVGRRAAVTPGARRLRRDDHRAARRPGRRDPPSPIRHPRPRPRDAGARDRPRAGRSPARRRRASAMS